MLLAPMQGRLSKLPKLEKTVQLQGSLVDDFGLATLDVLELSSRWVFAFCICLPRHGQVFVVFVGEILHSVVLKPRIWNHRAIV